MELTIQEVNYLLSKFDVVQMLNKFNRNKAADAFNTVERSIEFIDRAREFETLSRDINGNYWPKA